MKPVYIAAYHQSKFGKLMDMSVPEIVSSAVTGRCARDRRPGRPRSTSASIGAACNFSLNEQGLLAGLVAQVPGLEGKPIESVENACASGGQAVLSVIQKLHVRRSARPASRSATRRCATPQARWTASSSARCSATSRTPTSAPGKVFVFPHLFAEVMDVYMKTARRHRGGPRRDRGPGVRQREAQPLRPDAERGPHGRAGLTRSRASTATSSTACRSRPTTARRSPTATPP